MVGILNYWIMKLSPFVQENGRKLAIIILYKVFQVAFTVE